MRGDAAGERDFATFGVMFTRVPASFAGRELVLERVNALRAQCGELGLALFDQ
jgi:hypothetical protein